MAMHKCPFCKKNYIIEDALHNHMEKEHNEELHGLHPMQIVFNWRNKHALTKENGKCVMTGKPTKFNIVTGRYERFADEKASEQYREMFKKRMIQKYGKIHLLDDAEQQKKMLANRSISGEYKWENGSVTPFIASYERKFLEYLEVHLDWENPDDIMAPAPMTFPYTDAEGNQKFHIPDFYITSLNLIVNVKASDNKHYRLRDIDNERAQDEAIKKSNFNYLKLYDNKFNKFSEILNMIKNQQPNNKKQVFHEETNLNNIQLSGY
jgi:hypothetical protein